MRALRSAQGRWLARLRLALFLLGVLPLLAQAQVTARMPVSFADVLATPSSPPALVHRYGSSSSQFAELWLPVAGDRLPVVMLIHGGCWLEAYDIGHIRPLATRLASDGFAVWAPEYRRVGELGGGFPGSLADVERALVALAALQEPRIDLDRVVLAGHSAGGHLALWLAGRAPQLHPPNLGLRGALGLAAITDLAAYAAGDNSCEQVTEPFVGAPLQAAPQRFAALSPAHRPTYVPTLLLRGTQDPIVDSLQYSALAERQELRRRQLDGAGHFDWIHPDTAAYGLVLESLRQLAADTGREG